MLISFIICIPIAFGLCKLYTKYYTLPSVKSVNLLNPDEAIIGQVIFEPYSITFNKQDILNFTANIVDCHIKVIVQMRVDNIEFTRKVKLLNGAYEVIGNLSQEKVKTSKNIYFFDKDIPIMLYKNIDSVKITE